MECARPSDPQVENAMYNGWRVHSHCINNVIVYAPTGVIIWASLNQDGNRHDSACSHRLYGMLRDDTCTPPPYRIIADSAFQESSKLLKPDRHAHDSDINRDICSLRTTVEWGMMMIQRQWAILTNLTHLRFSKRHLMIIVHTTAMLYNMKTRMMGCNQIQSVFNISFIQHMQ